MDISEGERSHNLGAYKDEVTYRIMLRQSFNKNTSYCILSNGLYKPLNIGMAVWICDGDRKHQAGKTGHKRQATRYERCRMREPSFDSSSETQGTAPVE